MSRTFAVLLGFLIGALWLCSCRAVPATVPAIDMGEIAACQEDQECVIVVPECCGYYTAINREHLAAWDAFQAAYQLTCPLAVCEPLPPIDMFAARCIDSVCTLRDSSCEEEIEDPAYYQELFRQHPTVVILNKTLELQEIRVPDPCVMTGRVRAVLRYDIPAKFSRFGVGYRVDLEIWYRLDDASLEPGYDPGRAPAAGPAILDPESIQDYIEGRIQELEQDTRVAELLDVLGWDAAMGRVYLSGSQVRVQLRKGMVEFAHPFGSPVGAVYEYVVPNGVELEAFPEIALAHRIILEQLPGTEWAACTISTGQWAYSNTVGHRAYDGSAPWWLEVDLDCGGTWRTASVMIYRDGSYDRFEIH